MIAAGTPPEPAQPGGPSRRDERPTAVILLAGRSQRTWPLTADFPKPLLPLWGRPLTERVLDQLQGIVDTAVLVVGYQKQRILDHFGTATAGFVLSPSNSRPPAAPPMRSALPLRWCGGRCSR